MFKFFRGLLFIIIFFTIVIPSFSESAKICRLRGDVQYMLKGSVKWINATANTRIGYGDKLKTLSDSKAELIYPDGTVFRVASSTMIQMQMKSINILKGSTWVKVIKRATKFSVVTPTATAGVRGTVFDVEYQDKIKKTTVSVYNGKVAVSGQGRYKDRMVMLTKGTQSTVSNVPAKPRRFNTNERSKMWASVMNQREIKSSENSEKLAQYKKIDTDLSSKSANKTTKKNTSVRSTIVKSTSASSQEIQKEFFNSKAYSNNQNMTSSFNNISGSNYASKNFNTDSLNKTSEVVREKQQQEVEALKDKITSLSQSGTNITADFLKQNLNTKQNTLINDINKASYSVKISQEEREKAFESKQNFESFLEKTGSQLTKNLNSYGKKVVDSVFKEADYNQVTTTQKNYLNQLMKKKTLSTTETTQAFNIIADIINKSSQASQAAAAATSKTNSVTGLDKMSLRLPNINNNSQSAINTMATQLNQLKSIMNQKIQNVNLEK